MNAATERRAAPYPCPHCGSTRTTAHHYRDSGDLTPEAAEKAGYCPTLAAKRATRTTDTSPTFAPFLPPREPAPEWLWTADDARVCQLTMFAPARPPVQMQMVLG